MKAAILVLCVVVTVALAGCNRDNVSDVQRDPAGGIDATLTLTEQEVNDTVAEALSKQANPLLRNPTIDLQAGQLVINGTHERRDGQGSVSGSITITLTIQNGALLAQITQADIEGWDASDARISEFNQRLTEGFTIRSNRDRGQLTFKAVSITDSELSFTVNVKRA